MKELNATKVLSFDKVVFFFGIVVNCGFHGYLDPRIYILTKALPVIFNVNFCVSPDQALLFHNKAKKVNGCPEQK